MKNSISLTRELNNYRMVDIVKYVAAIMVICIHCNQLLPQEFLNFFVKQIICRIAVYFFFTYAYFVFSYHFDTATI